MDAFDSSWKLALKASTLLADPARVVVERTAHEFTKVAAVEVGAIADASAGAPLSPLKTSVAKWQQKVLSQECCDQQLSVVQTKELISTLQLQFDRLCGYHEYANIGFVGLPVESDDDDDKAKPHLCRIKMAEERTKPLKLPFFGKVVEESSANLQNRLTTLPLGEVA